MSIASLRFLRSIAVRALLLCAALGAALPVVHAQEIVVGRIASRGVVKRNDASGEIDLKGQPTWVMYDPDQKQQPLPCSEWARATADTQVMSAAEYSGWLAALSQAMEQTPGQAPIPKTKISADAYNGVLCFNGSASESAASAFPLGANTNTVVLQQPAGAATPCANLVFFQSPLRPDAKALGEHTQSVLLASKGGALDSRSGELLCEALGQIGYETAFMFGGQHGVSPKDTSSSPYCYQSSAPFAGSTQVDRDVWSFVTCPPGAMLLAQDDKQTTASPLMVWSPVYGAAIDMANYGAIRTDQTNSNGYYSLPYTTVSSFTFNFNVNARVAFDSFNPRMAASHYFYMTGSGIFTGASGTNFVNFPVELTMVHVRATLGNPSGGPDVRAAKLVGVTYKNLDLVANSTTYLPPSSLSNDIGLVDQISAPDLRDTEMFVYRVADGRLIGSRWGLSNNEIGWGKAPTTNGGDAQFEVSALVRGPASKWLNVVTNAFNPATYTPAIVGSDGKVLVNASFGVEVDFPQGTDGRNAYLREGDLVKVILVNRATGYIGSRLAKLARGASGLPVLAEADGIGADISSAKVAAGAPLQFSLKPPNLKVRVHREYDVEDGATKGQRDYVIGFEGSALSSDKLITVETEWYDADGSALPDDMPGFTGRLAKTILASEVPADQRVKLPGGGTAPVQLAAECGQADCPSDQVGMFSIGPGRHTHVIRVPEEQVDTSHFYVHVDAQPFTHNVDFQGRVDPAAPRFDVNNVCYRSCGDPNDPTDVSCNITSWSCIQRFGAGPGALAQRPSTYVPFLAPKYNKDATAADQQYASANKLPKPEPVYDWYYRPEMQFSIFDLDVKALTTIAQDGTRRDALAESGLPAAGKGIVELIYSLNDPDVAPLPGFTGDRKLEFTLGKQAPAPAVLDSSTKTIHFTQPQAIDRLQSDDFLTIRLVQDGDEGNVLWEYAFEQLRIKLEGGVMSVKPGEQKRATAYAFQNDKWTLVPATWTWTGDPIHPGVDASIDRATGMVSAAPSSEKGYITIRAQEVADPKVAAEAQIKIGCADCEVICETAGHGEANHGSVDAVFSLGTSSGGESAGSIFLRSHEMTAALYSPKALVFSTTNLDVEPVFAADKSLRQINAAETFVDIATDPQHTDAYEIRFFPPLAKQVVPDATTGFYAIGGTAGVVWRVENPQSGNPNSGALRLTETRGGHTTVHDYQWDPTGSGSTLKSGNDLTEEHRQETISGATRVVRVVKTDAAGVQSSVKELTYHTFPISANVPYIPAPADGKAVEEKLIRETLDPGPANDPGHANLVTETTYFEDLGGSYGKVKSVLRPDGSWVRYQYDGLGRMISETKPWLDAPIDAPESQAQVTLYDYTPADQVVDVLSNPQRDAESAEPRTVTEYALGNIVAKTFYLYQRTDLGDRTVIEERCSQPNCIYGAAGNLRTVTQYYPPLAEQASNSRVRSVQHPDGKLDSYTYEYGVYNATSAVFFNEPGSAVRQTVTHGTVQNPEGVERKTTREVSITDERGRGVRDETYVYTGANSYALTSWTSREYDAFGHMTKSMRSTGELERADWGCCSEVSRTDTRGITTTYSRDALQRVVISQRAGINTSYTYDADGRELSARRDGGSLSLTSSKSYDLAGRVLQSADESGLVTGHSYPSGGRQTLVTRPGQLTELTDQFFDGRQRSVTGTAVVPQFFTYSVNANGTRTTEVRLGTANSPVFQRTVTDMLGRTVRVERPAFGGAVATTETFYNLQGQVARTRSTGMADTLYEYDALGRKSRSWLDVNGDGQLNAAGSDRVSASDSYFSSVEGQWWQEIQQSVYAPSSPDPIVTSTSRSRLTGLGGGLVAEQVSIDLQGNETRTTVSVDPNARTETRRENVPDSTQDAIEVSVDGRLMTSTSASGVTTVFDYDGLGRPTGATDPRAGRSETHYDPSTGLVDFVKDAAGNATSFGYDLVKVAGTVTPTSTGRKLFETNALGKTTFFAYDERGELVRTWGDVPYPIEYVYDGYGRRTEMRTYRSPTLNFSTASWPTGTETAADPTRWMYEEATGLLLQKQDASNQAAQYTYDTAGRLKTRTWARPKSGGGPLVTNYGYDPATGELLSVDHNDSTPDVTYSYDRLGRQNTVVDAVGNRSFGYDPATLQLSTETMTGVTPAVLTQHYETSLVKGRPTGVTLGPSYDIVYGYDPTGRMNSANYTANGAHDVATYTYVPNSGMLAGLTTQAGQTIAYSYEAHRDLKTQVQNKFGSTVVSQYDYAYDAVGRRTSVTNSGSAFAAAAFSLWGYDDRNELTSSGRYLGTNIGVTTSPVPAQARAFAYDPIGNRKTSSNGGVVTNYAANALNQYATVGAQSPTYDTDGNLTNDGTKVFTYNAENQLVQVAPVALVNGSKRVTFVYDYVGRRVRKVAETFSGTTWSTSETKTWVYSGWNKVQESKTVGSTTTTKSFAWGMDLSQSVEGAGGIGGLLASADATGLKLFAYDGNGNVSELLTSAGVVNAHYEYDAFGNTVLSSGTGAAENCYRFSTKYADDETGLYYYGYRYYDAGVGRWVSRDPSEEHGGSNLYGFVQNTPTTTADLLGMWSAEVHHTIVYYWLASKSVYKTRCCEIDVATALIRGSDDVDGGTDPVSFAVAQSSAPSYQHAMRAYGQPAGEAEILYNLFVADNITQALQLAREARTMSAPNDPAAICNKMVEAVETLGHAYHAFSDSTSPAHAGFQEWRGPLDGIGATVTGKGNYWSFVKRHKDAETFSKYTEVANDIDAKVKARFQSILDEMFEK